MHGCEKVATKSWEYISINYLVIIGPPMMSNSYEHERVWLLNCVVQFLEPDSKVHGTNMGPTWVLSATDGPMLAPWTLLARNSSVSTPLVSIFHATCLSEEISCFRPTFLPVKARLYQFHSVNIPVRRHLVGYGRWYSRDSASFKKSIYPDYCLLLRQM